MDTIAEKIGYGNYRGATEEIVEKMRSVAEELGDTETVHELDIILGKLFNLPNINWKKAEEQGVWEIANFIK